MTDRATQGASAERILVYGVTGSGKTTLARYTHRWLDTILPL